MRNFINLVPTIFSLSFSACDGELHQDAPPTEGTSETGDNPTSESSTGNGGEDDAVGPTNNEVLNAGTGIEGPACANPAYLVLQAGVRDFYASPTEPANLTPAIINGTGNIPKAWGGFDNTYPDYQFGHGLQIDFQSFTGYQRGMLTLHVKAVKGSEWDNDTAALWSTGAAGAGGFNISAMVESGKDSTINIDLKAMKSGQSNLLADINSFHNLNVYIQDDIEVDSMTLELSCNTDFGADPPIVGVLRGANGCGSSQPHVVYLDNEDKKTANQVSGWIGASAVTDNTWFSLCAVDGNLFVPALQAGASFAVLALSGSCPSGFVKFTRHHDNEDNKPYSYDDLPYGSLTKTVGSKKDTDMTFCVSSGGKSAASSVFPDLGIEYAIFGGMNKNITPWAKAYGWVNLDDEDKNNQNQPGSAPAYASHFVGVGKNTQYSWARVR